MSTIELSLVEAFAGATVLLADLNARLLIGEKVEIAAYNQVSHALVRIASRLGLQRRQRDVTPTLQQYLSTRTQHTNGDDVSEYGEEDE